MRYTITALVFAAGIALILCAANPDPCIFAQEASPDGKNLFEKHCMNCHSEAGPASPLQLNAKSSEEWKTWFDAGKHLGQDLTILAPSDKLGAIGEYCVKNSAQTPIESAPKTSEQIADPQEVGQPDQPGKK